MASFEEGTDVAKGRHVVPPGVAVEELNEGVKKLANECPPELVELLDSKGLRPVYDKMVETVVNTGKTRNLFGKWRDGEFVAIIDQFHDDFAEKGVLVVFCRRSSAKAGRLRWMEFIDVDRVPDYVSQYDVSNFSGQVIKTIYTTLEFPYGVAVEQLKSWKGRKRLKEKIPTEVANMMSEKGLMSEYNALVDECVKHGVGRWGGWKTDQVQQILDDFSPRFEAKGVALFVSMKMEYIHHGPYGGHMEFFRWIEFVDREMQPNYHPQRDATTK